MDEDSNPIPDAGPVTYPDTTVGMLMQQRDEALASARAGRSEAERYLALATGNEARAAGLQEAITAMGGEPPA